MFKVVDYRARKKNKEKVIPYDALKPYVLLKENPEDVTELDFKFEYADMGERFSLEDAQAVNILDSSYDYILLWRCLLFEINAYSNPLSEDETMLLDEQRVINRLVLEAFLKKNLKDIRIFEAQGNTAPILTSLTLVENLIIAILGSNKKVMVEGFEKTENDKKKKRAVNIKKRNFLIFLKWLYEFEEDLSIHDIITMYTENKIEGLFLKNAAIDTKGAFESFNVAQMYELNGDVSFGKRSSEEGIPIATLYRYLSENLSIYGFEMMREMSRLLKKGIITYSKGIVMLRPEIDFTSGDMIIDIEAYINKGKIIDAVRVFNNMTREFKTKCPFCGEAELYFSKGAICKKCKHYIRKGYWGTDDFTAAQLSLLARVGRVFHFKNNKPLVLYLKEAKNKEHKLTAIPDESSKNF